MPRPSHRSRQIPIGRLVVDKFLPLWIPLQGPLEPNGNVVPRDEILPSDDIGNVGAAEFAGDAGFPPRSGDNNEHRQGGRRRGRRGGRNRRGGRDERGGERGERGDFNRNDNQPYAASEPSSNYAPPPVSAPVSIHDLDTTPRDVRNVPREPRPQATHAAPRSTPAYAPPKPTAAAPPPSPYEITNPESDKPKGGWWRKLTGQ